MTFLRTLVIALLGAVVILIGGAYWFYGPVSTTSQPGVFVVPKEGGVDVIGKLAQSRYIRHPVAFHFLFLALSGKGDIVPGGYKLDSNMNALNVVKKLAGPPDLVWATIPEGLRKEQVGEMIGKVLGWTDEQKNEWNQLYTLTNKPEYAEGVYFPDTYLIPRDETVAQVVQRFIGHFNEKFAQYQEQFTEKNIRWTTGLKIASLIQREAGGTSDMPLISGIIWNRLEKGMKLEIDATLQYAQGRTDAGWWGPVAPPLKAIDSPYNTYLYKGLPPTPIASPGLAAIDAALNPQETDCLFYLHDHNRQIHCARDYPGHLANIKKYLQSSQ